ncbi:MAG TPA: hypothetical protein VFC12_08430 [Terriglobales bacterium]|nr:hypothetical protein [Terriglobales bacterium]
MIPRAGGADSQFLSADELAVEAELQEYAARVAPLPSAAFMDRVMAAAERNPLPIAGRGPRVRASELVHSAGRRLGVALAQVAGGPSIPLRVRVQAGAMLVVVALLITAGAALAAGGAATVVTWVAGPQAPAAGSRPSASPALSPNQPSDTSPTSDQPNGSSNPGSGGQASPNPGNDGQASPNPSNPGSGGQASPNPSNPGNHGQPSQNPGNRPSDHPNASHVPGNGGGPPQGPKPTATPHP